jgi:hypothetical protein
VALPRHTASSPSNRSFGLTVGGVLFVWALIRIWRGHAASPIVLVVAGVLILAALVMPSSLRVPNALWMRLAHVLGAINTRILLGVLFFLIITPLGLFLRVSGRDWLRLKQPRGASGWVSYPQGVRNPRHYERMF